MTPETEQVPSGYHRRPRLSPGETPPPRMSPRDLQFLVRDAGARVRSGKSIPAAKPATASAPPTRPEQAAVSGHGREPESREPESRERGSIVSVVAYLAVLTCTVVGVYVAWRQGSAGGGMGGVVGGVALLAAAVLRLVLPARLVGLLGTRNRVIDVLTLAFFGGGLLVAGLVLPH